MHLKKLKLRHEDQHTRLGNHVKYKVVEGEVTIWSKEIRKGCVTKDTINSFLSVFGDVKGFYTDHNTDKVKYHGNPVLADKTGVEWTLTTKHSHAIY